ncbi:MAG: metal ABC transporter substrate-binding protein [Azospirillum sp.]|nr:metal ABC transporter substrate-binding protein [Azospirillum sp.]
MIGFAARGLRPDETRARPTRLWGGWLFLASLLALAAPATAVQPVPVVASFSILGDIVHEIGGDAIAVTTVVGPEGDAHVFEPSPADVRRIAAARLVVENGLGLEPWLARLLQAAGYHGPVVVAAAGIRTIAGDEAEHGRDPHVWQDAGNVGHMVDVILPALVALVPDQGEALRARATAFKAELAGLDREIRAALEKIPPLHRRIVTSHDAFGYYGHAYGVTFLAPAGRSTEAEASAGDVARLIRQIRKDRITAVFVESIANPVLIEQISRETKARIGGRVFSDALSGADGPATSYLAMMRHNTRLFAEALGGTAP